MMAESIFVPEAQQNSAPPISPVPGGTNTTEGATIDDANSTTTTAQPPNFGITSTSPSTTFANAAELAQSKLELAQSKIESLKKWTVMTVKCTKHTISEQLGKVTRTVDQDLEARIDSLRELHLTYQTLLKMVNAYTSHFASAKNTQADMAELFYQLSGKEDILKTDLVAHSESIRGVCQNGEILLKALNYFTSALQTLTEKTIQDTLMTHDACDQARLEYDVYRCELDDLRSNPNATVFLPDAEEKCNKQKFKYDQLKEDVRIKLTLLEENRAKVMRRQIALVQNAFRAYFEDNATALKSAVAKLEEQPEEEDPMSSKNGRHTPSFLEK